MNRSKRKKTFEATNKSFIKPIRVRNASVNKMFLYLFINIIIFAHIFFYLYLDFEIYDIHVDEEGVKGSGKIGNCLFRFSFV